MCLLEASHLETKASTSLKRYLKSLEIFQNVPRPTLMKKTSIYLEIILKSLELFEKASSHFKKPTISLKMSSKSLKKPQISY
jgi:hypothetical protein